MKFLNILVTLGIILTSFEASGQTSNTCVGTPVTSCSIKDNGAGPDAVSGKGVGGECGTYYVINKKTVKHDKNTYPTYCKTDTFCKPGQSNCQKGTAGCVLKGLASDKSRVSIVGIQCVGAGPHSACRDGSGSKAACSFTFLK
jgi:hypothetical protein